MIEIKQERDSYWQDMLGHVVLFIYGDGGESRGPPQDPSPRVNLPLGVGAGL